MFYLVEINTIQTVTQKHLLYAKDLLKDYMLLLTYEWTYLGNMMEFSLDKTI